MQILYLSIAGFIIKLVFHRSSDKQNKVTPERFCKEIFLHNEGFIIDFEPSSTDFIIEFLEAKGFDIYESPKKKGFIHFYSPVAYNHISTFYHISRVQFIYLLKSAVGQLLSKTGFVMHCSANLVNGEAAIYIGESGIGKTTLVSMLKKEYPILADDEGYIKQEGEAFYFYQGPFLERDYNFSKTYKRYAISTIFILEQGNACQISQPTTDEIRRVSLQLISAQSQLSETRNLLSALESTVPLQKIIFTKRKKELMDCVLNHPPFNNTPCLNTK
ncbi:phosphoenolpyruvate carboxykinase (ATP) [Candidatus Roizmanbacteria bacterium]|nr:MAG: phosphoenolpyruvate carboxykinase (ATP) [Candidatus Roizmanbacteria bacterium]